MTTTPITIVNFVSVEVNCPPDVLWAHILEEYLQGGKFADQGAVHPLEDASAVHGAYRLVLDHDGVVDERIVRITENNAAARRLSVHAEYLTVPAGGVTLFATYQARAAGQGSTFTIDCHAQLQVELPSGTDWSTHIANLTLGYEQGLRQYVEAVRARLEDGRG